VGSPQAQPYPIERVVGSINVVIGPFSTLSKLAENLNSDVLSAKPSKSPTRGFPLAHDQSQCSILEKQNHL
jgi:hypothetical protein